MTINLSKGQQVSLTKSGGGELGVVRMGLGWKSAPRKGFLARLTARDIDLDASAVLFAGRPGRRLLPAPHQRRRFGPAHR
ncbi:TerD family protein OS=Streptomyces microflavus OX=1919 GN=HUT09_02770 PE=4 SV=1 [Streptomyces microflavus]